jgi:uncharacterized membrane protein
VSEVLAYLTVLIAAAIPWLEVLLVVPAGIIAGLPPVPTAVVAAVGNIATLVPLVLGGERLRAWWRARRRRRAADAAAPTEGVPTAGVPTAGVPTAGVPSAGAEDGSAPSTRSGRATRLFDRYGLPGLAALGPLLTGVHVAAVVALAAGAQRRPTVVWLSAGVIVWSAIAAGATVFGIDALIDRDQVPDLGL